MKNEDKKTLIIFFVIIFLILIVISYNIYKNRKLDVNRKVEYIFNTLTYKDVYHKASELFNQATLLVLDKGLNYEQNSNGKINYYSIDNYTKCKKITNFWLVNNTFSDKEINKFMEYKKIINKENNYYIEEYKSQKSNYIGSIIEMDGYDESLVYFSSVNYYCENYEYIGVIDEEPDCNYEKEATKFSIILENNRIRINNLEEIKNIIK